MSPAVVRRQVPPQTVTKEGADQSQARASQLPWTGDASRGWRAFRVSFCEGIHGEALPREEGTMQDGGPLLFDVLVRRMIRRMGL